MLNRAVSLKRNNRKTKRNDRKNRVTRRRRGGQIIAFNNRAEPVYYK